MRMALSLLEVIGVHGCIVDTSNNELVAGWFLIPDKIKKSVTKKLKESKTWQINRETVNIARVNPSSCFVDKERKVDGLYKGYQSLYINNKVSFKNATLDKQYFLIKKRENNVKRTEEEIEEELKSQFFNKALKKLPLPINENWEAFVWKEIKDYFSPILIRGKVPYEAAYVMQLPAVNKLQELVEISHKSFEFKQKFKRVPQLSSVVSGVNDIEHFNFKEWQQMLQIIGGQEEFKKKTTEHQKAIIQAFEVFGPKEMVLSNVNLWHATSIKNIGIMLRRNNDKNEKIQIKNAFNKVFDFFENEQTYLYAAINSFPKLYEKELKNIKNGNLEPIKTFLNQIVYDDVTVGAEELATVCSQAKVSDSEYKMYESEYLEHLDLCLTSPRSYPTIKNQISSKIMWELLDMSIPRAWVVGTETHCCMHPSSCGGSCLTYAAKNPETSGILRVANAGKTVAQSFMWISNPDSKGYRTLVLDNIEVNGSASIEGLDRSASKSFVIDAYKDFAEKMEFYSKLFRIKAITIGTGYSDVNLNSFCVKKLETTDDLYAKKPDSLGYYDARTQWLFKKF